MNMLSRLLRPKGSEQAERLRHLVYSVQVNAREEAEALAAGALEAADVRDGAC